MKLMRDILGEYYDSFVILFAILKFIDYLLRLPDELSEKVSETIRPIIEEELNKMIDYKKEDWCPTMARVFETNFEEGGEQGILEERINIAHALLQDDLPTVSIVKITKLSLEEVEMLRNEMDK